MKFTDALSRELIFTSVPGRIVSLVPSLTELLCDLHLESDLVGVTKFCVHPANIRKEKVIVGGTKKVNIQKIRDLNPEIVIANKEENTPEIVAELEKYCAVYVTDVKSIDDNLDLILKFGDLFSKKAEAISLHARIASAFADFSDFARDIPYRRAAYLIWRNPWMGAGAKTFIDSMMHFNKFDNIFADERYPEFELQQLANAKPEIVLLSSEPYPFKKVDVLEMQKIVPAKIIAVDGEMFSWFGSRPLKAIGYFKELHGINQ